MTLGTPISVSYLPKLVPSYSLLTAHLSPNPNAGSWCTVIKEIFDNLFGEVYKFMSKSFYPTNDKTKIIELNWFIQIITKQIGNMMPQSKTALK